MRVAVVGAGHVGLVTGACLASLGHQICCQDIDEAKIAGLADGRLPIYETGLEPLFQQERLSGRLTFTASPEEALRGAEVAFICVGTPPRADGQADTTAVEAAARAIGRCLGHGYLVVVNKSTVPIGSGDLVSRLIEHGIEERAEAARNGCEWEVVSNPEFLREGSAVQDTLSPDRVVLGVDSQRGLEAMRELYSPMLRQAREQGKEIPWLVTDRASAEMVKYAANAFLATKISFINEIAQICARVGADVVQVADGIGMDHRIGRAFLRAGIGWGGSCFPKDLRALIKTARDYGHNPTLLEAAESVNYEQRQHFLRLIQSRLGVLNGKCVGLWGLAFKPGTDDLRNSPALELAESLLSLGAQVIAYDPVASKAAQRLHKNLGFAVDAYQAARGADAVALVTEWPEFLSLDWARLKDEMRQPLIFDGRNFLDPVAIGEAGLSYVGVGR